MTARKRRSGIDPNTPLCSTCGEPCGHPAPATFSESEFKIIAPHGTDNRSTMNFSGFQAQVRYMRVIELLYSDSRTPWKTYSDVMRAFVDYGCSKFAPSLGGEVIPGVLHTLGMMNKLIDQAREANDFASSLDSLGREIERLEQNDMRESAVGLVYTYREQAKGMPDRILRRRLVNEINQRFGHLLKGNQGRKAHEKPHAVLGTAEDTDMDADSERDEFGD